MSIFLWYGAVAPWASFTENNIIAPWSLVFMGCLVLLLRRLPAVLMLRGKIDEIEHLSRAIFVGFFGPIGVSAIFYLMVGVKFLDDLAMDPLDSSQEEIRNLQAVMKLVVWFLAMNSVVIHGLTLPFAKLCCWILYKARKPRTLDLSSEGRGEDSKDFRDWFLRKFSRAAGPRNSAAAGRCGRASLWEYA